MGAIRFTVWGEARPAGSKRAFPHPTTGKIIVADSSGKAGSDWRRAVADAAAEASPVEVLTGPVAVEMAFYRRRPKSHRRTGANAHLLREAAPPYPITRPDVLKLARACEDAMSGIVYADDAQIVHQLLRKRYGERPRVEIAVRSLDDAEAEVVPIGEAAGARYFPESRLATIRSLARDAADPTAPVLGRVAQLWNEQVEGL